MQHPDSVRADLRSGSAYARVSALDEASPLTSGLMPDAAQELLGDEAPFLVEHGDRSRILEVRFRADRSRELEAERTLRDVQ